MTGQLQLLLKKDIICLWRATPQLLATLGFALLLVVVSSFAFRQIGYGEEELKALTPGIVWLIFLFSGVLALNYSFLTEQENGAMQGVLLTPVDPALLYFSKFFSNLLFMVVVQLLVLFVHSLLFNVALHSVAGSLFLVVFLTAVGFAGLGTLLSAMAVCSRSREVLLPIMLFPLCLPLLAGAVFLTREVIASGSIEMSSFWFALVCGFDVISITLSWLLFEHVTR